MNTHSQRSAVGSSCLGVVPIMTARAVSFAKRIGHLEAYGLIPREEYLLGENLCLGRCTEGFSEYQDISLAGMGYSNLKTPQLESFHPFS